MKKIFSKEVVTVIVKATIASLLLAWFCIPCGMFHIDLFSQETAPELLFPFSLPFSTQQAFYAPFATILSWSVYFVPTIAIFLIVSIFKKEIPFKYLYWSLILALTIMVYCCVICFILSANTARWFLMLPPLVYISILFSFIAHIVTCIIGIRLLRIKNPRYVEYIQYIEKQDEENKQEKKRSQKLKTKLLITVIGVISFILLLFASIMLHRYNQLIIETVSDTGRTQAEQTAAVYDSAEGKYEKIKSFFNSQRETNSIAGMPFDRIDIIITNEDTSNLFLEEIDNTKDLPDFLVFAYTTAKSPGKISEKEKKIYKETAKDYIRRYKNGSYRKEPVYDSENSSCKYVYPVTLTRPRGHKLVGFAVVTYREDVLMAPFFQTKVSVYTLVIILLYFSILLALFVSDYIVNPLLFLRVNVRKASDSLSDMMSGSAKITPSSLKFNDEVKTKDEVKDLSLEIENMVTIIRGIIPYVSISTLRNAEREKRKSTSRELCFLFTDIRGFTTLCEGLPPKDVVNILNLYLNIETEIILNNGGDVDKFVGDEMMAFFSGPKKEINACTAAMQIRSAMMEQRDASIKDGVPIISIGIGINTGKVVFGPVGSKTRMDFTSIGDTVNLAARLEGANKAYGSKSIITDAVYDKLQGSFICRELDYITVKGKTKPVQIYEVLQIANRAVPKLIEIKTLFEKGLSFYRKKNWDKAETYFKECEDKYSDIPSKVFIERISHFRLNPPPTRWDGVFRMDVK